MKQRTLLLLCLLLLLFTAHQSEQNVAEDDNWLAGWARSLKGGKIDYHSPQPGVDRALLIRSQDSREYIEWETDELSADFEGESANFIWVFALDVNRKAFKYELFLNGKPAVSFRNPVDSKRMEWKESGVDGIVLHFRSTMVDRHNDLMGYLSLKVPKKRLRPGKAQKIRIVAESAASNAWYMTFEHHLSPSIRLVPRRTVLNHRGKPQQPVDIQLVHLGAPTTMTLSWSGQEQQYPLVFGFNRLELKTAAVNKRQGFSVKLQLGNSPVETVDTILEPVKPWTVYLVQHTHTDIGYTRSQSLILPEHLRFIDFALDYCDATDHLPDAARFRWTCESSWAVRQYLTYRPAKQVDRLRKRVEEGRIEITGMLLNMAETAEEASFPAFLAPLSLFKRMGFPVSGAMQNDVNGIAWCLADFFPDAGISYLTMGQHGHRALIPFDMPTAFWWESPSGRRVLAYRPDHYMTGNFWGIHTGNIQTFENGLLSYLGDLEKKGYPHDRIAVQYSGYSTDNAPPSTVSSDLIQRWNESHIWPRLRSATVSEFPKYILENYADTLAVHRKAWPDWWTDGFGSASRETAVARDMQADMITNQGLLAMALIHGLKIPDGVFREIDSVQEQLLFYNEHTFGAAESIRDPYAENTQVQWAEKSGPLWSAVRQTRLLREYALGLLQSVVPKRDIPGIAVFNSLNWKRSGYVEIYIDHEILAADQPFRLLDDNGKTLAMQHISSRPDGSLWGIWAEEVPALGYRVFRVEKLTGQQQSAVLKPFRSTVLENEYYRLTVDAEQGGIASLYDRDMERELLDPGVGYQLGEFIYETLSNRQQLEQFRLVGYSRDPWRAVKLKAGTDGPLWKSIILSGETAAALQDREVDLEIRLFKPSKRVDLCYRLWKRPVQTPESVYIAFPFALPGADIVYEAQGGMVVPGRDQLPGTASDWHTVQNFASVRGSQGQVVLCSPQIPLMQFGGINTGEFKYIASVEQPHIYSWVLNNYWVTNFKASQEGELRWDYSITSGSDQGNRHATRFAWGRRVPLAARLITAGKQQPGTGQSRFLLEREAANLLLVQARPGRDGKSIIFQLRECDGREIDIPIEKIFSQPVDWSLTRVNVLGEEIRPVSGRLHVDANESFFLKLVLR